MATNSTFISTLKKYTEVDWKFTDTNIDSLQLKLKEFTTVIIGYHKTDAAFKNHDFTSNQN